jgi:hypothetical protein
MLNKRIIILPLLIGLMAAGLTACGDGAPPEEEVKAKYTGTFCDGFYKTELRADGTYWARRTMRGPVTGAPVAERCEGKYTLVHETGLWKLVFEKSSENSNQLVSCQGEQVIWQKDTGYSLQDSTPSIKDLFEGKTLIKDNCE